jgi:TPR repeat protein
MFHLGRLYEIGCGVAKDYGKAYQRFQRAADAGETDSM